MSELLLSRRSLLLGSVAAAATTALPTSAPAMQIGGNLAAMPDKMAWIIGTPGEYDWRPIFARTAEEAFEEYLQLWGRGDDRNDDPDFDIHEYVERIPQWDSKGLDSLGASDWQRAGLGFICQRCSLEVSGGEGYSCGGEAFCEECITFAERVTLDRDGLLNDLVNDIFDVGPDELRQVLIEDGNWDKLPSDLWDEAVAAWEADKS